MYKQKSKNKWKKLVRENANSSIDYDAHELDIESSDRQHISDFVESCSDSSDGDWF